MLKSRSERRVSLLRVSELILLRMLPTAPNSM